MTTTPTLRTAAAHEPTPYDAVAEDYDRLVRPRYEAIASLVADRASRLVDLPGADVVELSAGTGALTHRLAPQVGSYVATDISKRMLQVAQRRAGAEGGAVTWLVADVQNTGLPGSSADLVVSSLGPVQDSEQGLAEARRVLRPAGRVVVCTWGDDYRELELTQQVGERLGLPPRPVTSARTLHARLAVARMADVVVREVRMPVIHPSVLDYVAYRQAFGRSPDLSADRAGEVRRVLAECAERYVDPEGRLVLDWHLLLASARRV